jgi:hypothetical protein
VSDERQASRLVKALNDIPPRDRLPLVMWFGFCFFVLFVLVPVMVVLK